MRFYAIESSYDVDDVDPQSRSVRRAANLAAKGKADADVRKALRDLESLIEEGLMERAYSSDISRLLAAEKKIEDAYREQVRKEIEDALGRMAVSKSNPSGGTGLYDAAAELPYRVRFCESDETESYRSLSDAVEAAEDFCDLVGDWTE